MWSNPATPPGCSVFVVGCYERLVDCDQEPISEARIIMLTTFEGDVEIQRALVAGKFSPDTQSRKQSSRAPLRDTFLTMM